MPFTGLFSFTGPRLEWRASAPPRAVVGRAWARRHGAHAYIYFRTFVIYTYLSTNLSIYLSTYIFLYLYLAIYIYIYVDGYTPRAVVGRAWARRHGAHAYVYFRTFVIYTYLSINLSIYLSTYIFLYLYLSIYIYIYVDGYTPRAVVGRAWARRHGAHAYIHCRTFVIYTYLSINLSIYLSTYIFLYLYISISIYIYSEGYTPRAVVGRAWARRHCAHAYLMTDPSIHTYIYIYTYTHTHIYIYIHIHTYIYIHIES